MSTAVHEGRTDQPAVMELRCMQCHEVIEIVIPVKWTLDDQHNLDFSVASVELQPYYDHRLFAHGPRL